MTVSRSPCVLGVRWGGLVPPLRAMMSWFFVNMLFSMSLTISHLEEFCRADESVKKDPRRRHSSLCLPVPPLSSRWSRWLCQSENSLSTRSNEGQQNPCMELTSNTSKITTQTFSVYGTDLENIHTSSSLRTTSSVLRRWNCFLTEISEVSGLPEWTNQLRSGPFPKMYEITWNIQKKSQGPQAFLGGNCQVMEETLQLEAVAGSKIATSMTEHFLRRHRHGPISPKKRLQQHQENHYLVRIAVVIPTIGKTGSGGSFSKMSYFFPTCREKVSCLVLKDVDAID